MTAPADPTAAANGGVMRPLAATVARRRDETADTVTLVLAPESGFVDPEPGQFCMLWSPGVGEVAISVSGVGEGTVAHTVKRVGAVTAALCRAEVGELVGLRGPFGRGWDLSSAEGRDVVLVGGGIGLAPLRPAVEAVRRRRDDFDRVVVVIGARSPADLVFRHEIEQWSAGADLDVRVTVDRADATWTGGVGVVTRQLSGLPVDPARTTALVCGPEVMIRFVARQLLDLGIDADHVQVSLERNMRCGVGLCGHCQLGPLFVCREGPVQTWPVAAELLSVRER